MTERKRLLSGTWARLRVRMISGVIGICAVASDSEFDDLEIITEAGPGRCLRHEVSVLRDQQTRRFPPMRYSLPYGQWRCRDGREILFNREYRAIWERHPGQAARRANLDEWVEDSIDQQWFFDDGNPPWIVGATARRCNDILRAFGAQPQLVDGKGFVAAAHDSLWGERSNG